MFMIIFTKGADILAMTVVLIFGVNATFCQN